MIRHDSLDSVSLHRMIRDGHVCFAGNRRLKIFGRLDCPAGRRMARDTRVFFASRSEAEALGYRPCARCLATAYDVWKSSMNSGIQELCGPVAHQDRATDS